MARVSVVIPAYNRARSIETAVQSVLSQTYQDFEVIIVDDASEDTTPAVLDRLQERDVRIRCFRHNTNRGAQAARNTGIKNSNARWIAFLDSDDQWLPDSLEMRFRAADTNRRKVVHSECLVLTTESDQPRPFGIPHLAGDVYLHLLQGPGPMYQSLLATAEALARIGYLDEGVIAYQEWDTAVRLARFYEFEFLPEPTFIYDCRHTDTISRNYTRSAEGYEYVFTKHRWAVLRQLGPRALVRHYQAAAEMYQRAEDEVNARRCLRQAFLLWPFRPRTIFKRVQRAVIRRT